MCRCVSVGMFSPCTVVQARSSRSKPDRGLVYTAIEILNQDRETVGSLTMMNLLRFLSVAMRESGPTRFLGLWWLVSEPLVAPDPGTCAPHGEGSAVAAR